MTRERGWKSIDVGLSALEPLELVSDRSLDVDGMGCDESLAMMGCSEWAPSTTTGLLADGFEEATLELEPLGEITAYRLAEEAEARPWSPLLLPPFAPLASCALAAELTDKPNTKTIMNERFMAAPFSLENFLPCRVWTN